MAEMDYSSVISAADNHNLANGDESFLERVGNNLVDEAKETGLALTVGAGLAGVSGLTGIANSAITVANWFGADADQLNVYNMVQGLDDDLGQYYLKHQTGIDTVGFIASSLIPGTAGVKALRLVQGGALGANLGRATNLFRAATTTYADAAKAEILAGSPFSVTNTNVIKSLAAGFGAQTIDAAAFETAVAATMFKSPTLDGQSLGDLGTNIITGGLIGGTLGGLLHAVGGVYGLRKVATGVNKELLPFQNFGELADNAGSDLKILSYKDSQLSIPAADAQPGTDLFNLQNSTIQKTNDRLGILQQQEFNKLAGGDVELATSFNTGFQNVKTTEDAAAAILHIKSISRIGETEARPVSSVVTFNTGAKLDDLVDSVNSGDFTKLLNIGKGVQKNEAAFEFIGDASELKATGWGMQHELDNGVGNIKYENPDHAFSAGFDIFRNKNGTFSVNPNSQIIKKQFSPRGGDNLIVDLEKGGQIVQEAKSGLNDLGTPKRPVEVVKNTVSAGGVYNKTINFDDTFKFNPVEEKLEDVQARYLWAKKANLNLNGKTIGEYDFPLLERAYLDSAKEVRIKRQDGSLISAPEGSRLKDFITDRKLGLQRDLDDIPGTGLPEQEYRLNVNDKFLLENNATGWMKYTTPEMHAAPRFAKTTYEIPLNQATSYSTNTALAMKDYQVAVQRAEDIVKQNAANYFGANYSELPEAFFDETAQATGEAAGAGLTNFTNGNYGSATARAQSLGAFTAKWTTKVQTKAGEELNAVAGKVLADPVKGAELSLINNKLRSEPQGWMFSPTKENALIKIEDFDNKIRGETLELSPEVGNFLQAHVDLNSARMPHVANLRGAAGLTGRFDPRVVYPIPINTQNYRNFVQVVAKDPATLAGERTKTVIAAKDEKTLNEMIARVDKNKYDVFTKQDSEEFHKAIGDYDQSLGFGDLLVDSELKRQGVMSEFLPATDGKKVVDEFLDWHLKQEEMLSRSMIAHRYSQDFNELRRIGEQTTNISTSKYGTLNAYLKDNVQNNYTDLIKTSLNISRASEYSRWTDFNDLVRRTIEAPVNAFKDIYSKAKEPNQAFVDSINETSRNFGLGQVYKDAADAMVANGNIADKPWLPKAIAKAHAILSGSILQLDFFNAINNTIGTPILLSSEMSSLRSAISSGDAGVAGKLAQLTSTALPGQDGVTIPSTMKLILNALKNYGADRLAEGSPLLTRYQRLGTVTDILTQERSMLSDLTMNFGSDSESVVSKKLASAFDKGRTLTGNRMAEEMTRFIASDVMRQVTDLGVEGGVISAKEAGEYIQTFVNRVQGNYVNSQRPIIFQGVVGQSISLFQTYQFNLMQQLFRYVGEGDKKSVAMLLGLQGSIYGAQGMPAFNFLNTHIVGNAAGNTEHKDLYNAAYSTFGKGLGDWLLYGAGSNALSLIDPSLKTNIYSRGDINPRQVTVLPSSIDEIPVVAASVKFVQNLWNVGQKLNDGGAFWPSVSQGLEHNGLSRPLAGLAQVAQGYTTTSQGSLLSSQDLWSVATASRLLGGKPFDEAVSLDALYRVNAYRAHDLASVNNIGEALKTTLVAGGHPTPEQTQNFMAEYVKAGGKQEGFNRFMGTAMTKANASQVNALANNLASPYSKQLQIIMGGKPIQDFQNTPQATEVGNAE